MKKILLILGILLCINFIIMGICQSFASNNHIDMEEGIFTANNVNCVR